MKQNATEPQSPKNVDVTVSVSVKSNASPGFDKKSPADVRRSMLHDYKPMSPRQSSRHKIHDAVNGLSHFDFPDTCKKTIPCPVCKAKATVSQTSDVDKCLEEISENHLLVTLIESIDDQPPDRNCESCSKADFNLPEKAEKWCTNCRIAFCAGCIKAHNVIKACREHIVVSLKDMRVDPLNSLKNHKNELPCNRHKEKTLEFYCSDCKEVICSSCVAVQHRRCEQVETASDANRKLRPEAESLLKDMEMEIKLLRECEKSQHMEIDELNANKDTIMKEISAMRNKINEKLLELEKKLSHDLDAKHVTGIQTVNDKLSDINGVIKKVEYTNLFLKHLLQYGNDGDVLSNYDKVATQVKHIKELTRKPRSNKLSIKFKLGFDPAVSKLLEAQTLGKVHDHVDMSKEPFMVSNSDDFQGTRRGSSVRRSGTFKVDKSETNGKPSTSNESVNSKEEAAPKPAPRSARRAGTLPRNFRGPRAPSGTRISRSGSKSDITRGAATLSLPKQSKIDIRSHKDMKPPSSSNHSLTQLCAFNGRTVGDTKKCWPLDVAVLSDGTPVITDFHNKKIKAFDASGNVMGEVSVPSWPHGICDISKDELSVTLPELSTIVFVYVQESGMRIRRRIRTTKQYRGVACDDITNPIIPNLVVTCCTSGNQSADVITLDGVVLQSFRDDSRMIGRSLFTWPYYITTNPTGDMVISDCETRNGVLCLSQKGIVKQEFPLSENHIQDPRGICTDTQGAIFLADKAGNAVHIMRGDGTYDRPLITKRDGIMQPIALCISPFGQLIITQENGDIKVFQYQ